ncbi:hypothetical protein [Streptomyces sp. NPDC002853]
MSIPWDPRKFKEMLPFLTREYGNPSSQHAFGRIAAMAVRTAHRQVADPVGHPQRARGRPHLAPPRPTTWLPSAPPEAARPRGGHIVTTAIEHEAAPAACQRLVDHHDFTLTRVRVDRHGRVRPGRSGTRITTQQTSGKQERGLRAGTPNVPAIAGLGAAAHLITTDAVPAPDPRPNLRDRLQDRLLAAAPGATLNGHLISG